MKQDREIIMKYQERTMNLNRNNWDNESYQQYLDYLVSLTNTIDKVKRREIGRAHV